MTWEVPLRQMTAEELARLQARYPDAKVRIETAEGQGNDGMDEKKFWSVIDMLDWSQEESGKVLEPAILKLGACSKEAICQFQEILSTKLFDLDAKRFAEELGSNAWPPDEEHGRYFSVDDFLYSRCAVVANGKHFYESVVRDPSHIPKEFTFEPLLYLADRAWSRKTGEPLDCFPTLSYETFSNAQGWPGVKLPPRRIK